MDHVSTAIPVIDQFGSGIVIYELRRDTPVLYFARYAMERASNDWFSPV